MVHTMEPRCLKCARRVSACNFQASHGLRMMEACWHQQNQQRHSFKSQAAQPAHQSASVQRALLTVHDSPCELQLARTEQPHGGGAVAASDAPRAVRHSGQRELAIAHHLNCSEPQNGGVPSPPQLGASCAAHVHCHGPFGNLLASTSHCCFIREQPVPTASPAWKREMEGCWRTKSQPSQRPNR